MKSALLAFLMLALGLPFTLPAAEPDWAPYFQGKDGCFLLYDLKANQVVHRFNKARCAQAFSPCSTFKIPLSLMAFDRGILKDATTTYKWDGVDRWNPTWNRDTSAADWIKNSVVWYSQRLTPQLGPDAIKTYLAGFDYGNQDISGGLTNFWLGSSLKISADEQLRFMERFWRGKLPVSLHAIEVTRKIVYQETSPAGTLLSGKTGSHVAGQEELGWFVGHVDGPRGEYLIVVNYTGPTTSTKNFPGLVAKGIGLEILKKLGLF